MRIGRVARYTTDSIKFQSRCDFRISLTIFFSLWVSSIILELPVTFQCSDVVWIELGGCESIERGKLQLKWNPSTGLRQAESERALLREQEVRRRWNRATMTRISSEINSNGYGTMRHSFLFVFLSCCCVGRWQRWNIQRLHRIRVSLSVDCNG